MKEADYINHLFDIRGAADSLLELHNDPGWNTHNYDGLYDLIGLKRDAMLGDWKEDHIHTCALLAGPNGYAVYRAAIS
jgi:hypothetical protein